MDAGMREGRNAGIREGRNEQMRNWQNSGKRDLKLFTQPPPYSNTHDTPSPVPADFTLGVGQQASPTESTSWGVRTFFSDYADIMNTLARASHGQSSQDMVKHHHYI